MSDDSGRGNGNGEDDDGFDADFDDDAFFEDDEFDDLYDEDAPASGSALDDDLEDTENDELFDMVTGLYTRQDALVTATATALGKLTAMLAEKSLLDAGAVEGVAASIAEKAAALDESDDDDAAIEATLLADFADRLRKAGEAG